MATDPKDLLAFNDAGKPEQPSKDEIAAALIDAQRVSLLAQAGQEWTVSWQQGELPWTDEQKEWFKTRPNVTQEAIVKFPSGALVKAIPGFETNIPAAGTLGVVHSWHNLGGTVFIGVLQNPRSIIEKVLPQYSLEVVGYARDETPEKMQQMLDEVLNDGTLDPKTEPPGDLVPDESS